MDIIQPLLHNAPVTLTVMAHTVIYVVRIVINRDIILVVHGKATLQDFANLGEPAMFVTSVLTAKGSKNYETVFKSSCDSKLSYSNAVDS